ncbi:MAG: metallophosphoesterase [Legionella sp.]|jgi:predicted MPP superfamily phosphohydrolase
MKMAWMTDIHLNFIDLTTRQKFYQEIIDSKCNSVLLSGDIAEAPSIKNILQELAIFIKKPIYFVLGNHDYYRGQVDEVRIEMTALTESNEYLFWLPYFSSKASGDVLMNICTKHPNIDFLVLCGHTHGKAIYHPFPNLIVEAGHAEYKNPEIQNSKELSI